MVSAVKVGGRRLHELARRGHGGRAGAAPGRGRSLRRRPDGPPPGSSRCDVECSSGTYVRVPRRRPRRRARRRRTPGTLRRTADRCVHGGRRARRWPRLERDRRRRRARPGRGGARPRPRRGRRRGALAGAHGASRSTAFRSARWATGRGRRRPRRAAARRLRGHGDRPHRGPPSCSAAPSLDARARSRRDGGRSPPSSRSPTAPGRWSPIGAYDGVHLGHRHVHRHRPVDRAAERGLETRRGHLRPPPRHRGRARVGPAARSPTSSRGSSCSPKSASTVTMVVTFDEIRAQGAGRGLRRPRSSSGRSGRATSWSGRTSISVTSRKGNVALLERARGAGGFERRGRRRSTASDGEPVSSTRIRSLVAAGDVTGAASLLGRPHQVRGTVVHGDGRGGADWGSRRRTSRCPPTLPLPGDGVYAGRYARPDGSVPPRGRRRRPAPDLLRPGRRPTSLVEAYLLDFDGDLYDESAPRSPSSPASETSGGSTRSRTWWPRCTWTWPSPAACSKPRA